jgi:hypothetical protein
MRLLNKICIGVFVITAISLLFAVVSSTTLAKSIDEPMDKDVNASKAWEELKQLAEKQKISDEQQIIASVSEHYKKLKDSGRIPVIDSPTKINLKDASANLYTASDVGPVSTLSTKYWVNDHDFGHNYILYGVGAQYIQIYEPSGCRLRNLANVVGGGAGGIDAWGWSGTTFTWNGPTGNYNIAFDGWKSGYTTAYGTYASASTSIDCCVLDHTTNNVNSQNDYSRSVSGIGYESVNQAVARNFVAQLVNGRSYSIYIKVDGQAITYGAGSCASDFYTNPAGLWFYSATIS